MQTSGFAVSADFAGFASFCYFWVILSRCCAHLECLVVKLDTNFLDLILMLQNKQLISIGEHDSYWLPPRVKTRAFDISTRFASFAHFCDIHLTLSKCCARLECFVVRLVANFHDLIFILQNKHLMLILEHYSRWFPLRVKTRAFGVWHTFYLLAMVSTFGWLWASAMPI